MKRESDLDYFFDCAPEDSEDICVSNVPLNVVWIDGSDADLNDECVVMRCIPTAMRFVQAAIHAEVITKDDVLAGKVVVGVDRSDSCRRGDVNVETMTDVFSFRPANRALASGSEYVPVRGADLLDDVEPPENIQARGLRDLMLAGSTSLPSSPVC